MVSGDTLKIRDVCMDFEPYFKIHNLVSVYPRSIILSQITNLNMIFHVVVSVYRLVKFETRPSSPMNFGMANRCAIFITLYPSMQMSVFPKLTNQECLLRAIYMYHLQVNEVLISSQKGGASQKKLEADGCGKKMS